MYPPFTYEQEHHLPNVLSAPRFATYLRAAGHFFHVFPDAPRGVTSDYGRSELRANVEEIRRLRNRIAHHEPIFLRALQDDFDRLLRCIQWRNAATATWVKDIETVQALLPLRPPLVVG